MKPKPLTIAAPETDPVFTRGTQLTYRRWLELEAARMIASGRNARVSQRTNNAGQVLVWMEEVR